MSSPSSTSSSSSSASSSYSMPNQSISRRSKNHNVPVAFDQDKTNGDDVHFSIRNSNISDDEQLDDRPFLSHRLSEGNESFSEKFLRNILTPNYQNLMPRRREKFVEIIKTVTVTEVVNGGSDHPSKCEVKVTNVSPGPIPVNVSIKHHHEKFHSCEDLQQNSTGTSTVIRVHRSPFEKKSLKHRSSSNHSDCNQIRTTIDEKRIRSRSIPALRNLEFTHPILIETSKKPQMNGNSARPPSRQNIGDVRKRTLSKTMTTTTTETTETEKVMKTTKRRSSSSQSGSRSQDSPEVQTLYYRKFIETTNDDDEEEEVKLRRDSFNRRSRSEDHRKMSDSPPIPPQRQRKVLGREESLHYYRDDDEVVKNHEFCSEKRTNETTSINDSVNQNNFTAGVTRVLMNDTCADSSRESKSSTIPQNKINHIEVKVTGPSDDTLSLSDYPIVGHVGDDITMKFYLDEVEAPPKPPRRSKGELRDLQVDDDNVAGCIGEPLMTSTPMTTIQRKINRESVESDETPSRKSTKSSRPPDINIIECEMMEKDSRSPARTPNTPIVVVNQTPTSRRSSSQDLLSDQSRRRKNTVTDIDWYAAFNMKDPPSPAGNLLRISQTDGRKSSQEHRRRASESSINIPAAEIDLNQIFCTANYKSINDDDKCKCNACRLTRMNDEEIQNRFTKAKKIQNQDLRSNTLPTRRFVPTIEIELDEVFNPKKPPTPPKRSSIRNVFSAKNGATSKIDHEKGGVKQKNLSSNDTNIDWIGEMIKSTKDWEESSNRKISTSSSSSSLSRKSSITRKISIEKLKQSKRCQTSEMILPPSKTSIDEIVTALTSKPQNLDSTKTFLITRKWTNQEMEEALDSNKIEKPIAPPRRLNQKQRKLSEANINENTTNYDDGSESTIIFSQAYKNPSLAINIDELNLSNTGKNKKTSTSIRSETKNQEKSEDPSSSSTVNLDDVFVSTSGIILKSNQDDDKDKKISQRISEFRENQCTKDLKTEEADPTVPRTLNESNIDINDIFTSKPTSHLNPIVINKTTTMTEVEEDSESEKKTSTSIRNETKNQDKSEDPSSSSTVNLDDVFVSTSGIILKTNDDDDDVRKVSRQLFNNSIVSDSTISLENSFNSRKNDDSDEKNVEKILQNNWISDLVKKERKEEKEEGDETWKSSNQKKSISIFNQSPTRISSEIKYEWISDILSNNSDFDDQQIDQISGENDKKVWISSATYHPTIDSSTYTLKAHNSAEPTANEMNSNFDGENEDFLDNVFKSFECHSPKASEMDQCVCSACRLSQLSDDQLAELRQKWRMRKNIEDLSKIEEKENVEEEKFDGDASSFISIDDLFNFQKSKSSTINAEFTTETKGQVEGSKNEFYSSIIDEINLDEILPSTHPTESLHIETCDESSIRHPTTPSPTIINTKTYVLSPRVSITETIRQNHEWKREKSTTTNNEEILSPSSMISDDSSRQDSRRFSTFYEDRANGWDTIRSEDSGVMSSTGGRLSRNIVDDERKITELVIDEAFKDIFDEEEKKKKKKNYDDYYISSLNEERNESDSESSAKFLDVTQFVDEILGKSMDEAAFLSSTKSFQQRNHTDTSIDCKKSMKHPYYRLRTDTSNDRKTTIISEDNYDQNGEGMKSILTKSETSENTNSTSKTSDEEILEIEVNSDAFLVKGSYSLVIPKNDPLGQLLEKIYAENQSFAKLDVCLTKKIKKLLLEVIKEKGEGNVNYYKEISRRGNQLISSTDYASSTFLKMNSNKFDLTKNPNGIVNFCTAENNICTPLLEEHFKHIELFFPNTEHLVRYPPSGGWLETRETLVKYFKKFMNADIDVSDLVLTASTRTGYDIVSYCLFEPNDILLTNGPVYSGTISNCNERAKCVVECVKTNLMAPKLDVNEFEKKLQKINKTDQNVAGIIIVNPHNPLGIVFPAEDVIKLCNWASSHNLKVIIDEVFSNCVFDKSARFYSFLSYYQRLQNPEDVAFLWSVSKDFGMPGLKFAVIHSKNLALQNAATKLQMYFPCSPFVQDFAVKLLNDHDWLTVFHKEVKRRIEIHYNFLAKNLNLLEIPFVSAQAGIFVFADFSKFLKSIDEEAELNFWQQLGEGGVMLTPGVHQKCDQFGWFRIVYACSKEELEEGVRRLYKLLKSPYQTIGFIQY